jgi:hypothetical protein
MIITDKLSLEMIIVQCQGNIVSDMNGEKVMLSIENGKYYNLGTTGGIIWDQINSPISIEKLITFLTETYSIDFATCKEQVTPFLEHLLKENLIEINKE